MSKESANRFLSLVAHDENLRDKFQNVATPDEFIKTAEAAGYDFTTDELQTVVAELSEGIKVRRKTGVWQWLRTVNWR
jgi:predicted ribosomally synthesized peptide with nif11-like leader